MKIDLESMANEAVSNLANSPSGLRKWIIEAKRALLKHFFEMPMYEHNSIGMDTSLLDSLEFLILQKAAGEFAKRTQKGGAEKYLDIFEFIYSRMIEIANDKFSGIRINPKVHVELSKIYYAKRDIPSATYHAEVACKAMPQNPYCHNLLASCYDLLHRQTEAIAHLQIAQSLEQSHN